MKSINRILIIALSVFAMSCFNDNPSTPNNGGDNNGGNGGGGTSETTFDFSNFVPLDFEEFILEQNGNLIPTFTGKLQFDEMKTIAKLNGTKGYEIDKKYNKAGKTPDDEDFVYVAMNGGKQFYINDEVVNSIVEVMSPEGIDLPFELPDDTYYKLIDLDAPTNQTQVLAELPYKDDDLNPYVGVDGKIIFSITKLETENFSYKGNNIKAHKVVASITFDGNYTVKSQNGVTPPTPTKVTMDMNFLVHHKMGIVKQWVPFTNLKLAAGIEIPIKGYQFQVK